MNENELSDIIIDCAIDVQKHLGSGLLKLVYQEYLFYELKNKGLNVIKEKSMPVTYGDLKLDHGYEIDLLVNNEVIVEIRTAEAFKDVDTAQVLTYLKLGNFKQGLLLNFHLPELKNGIKRIIN